MFGRGLTVLLGVWLLAMPLAAVVSTKEAGPDNRNAELSEREQMYRRYQKSWDYVDGATEPHWRADGSSVWFAEDGPDNRVFYRVDPEAKTVTPVFDTPRVRAALELQLGHELPGKGLPFTEFRFVDDNERYVEFEVENQRFRLELGSHELSVAGTESAEETETLSARHEGTPSSDGRWVVAKRDHDLWLGSTEDSTEIRITQTGEEYVRWYPWSWSPDSSHRIPRQRCHSITPSEVPLDYRGPGKVGFWMRQESCGTFTGPFHRAPSQGIALVERFPVRLRVRLRPSEVFRSRRLHCVRKS